MEPSSQPEKSSTLSLCFDRIGIDAHAAINRTDDPLDFDRAIGRHFDLGDLRHVTSYANCTEIPRPCRAGSGDPHPAFSAATDGTASARGMWPSKPLR